MTPDQLASYLAEARWFGGKGRAFEVTEVISVELAPGVSTNLVHLAYADGGTDLYQVPVSSYDEPQERLGHALIGFSDGQHHYDAVHDREAMGLWLRAFAGAPDDGLDPRLEFRRTDDHTLDADAHSTLFSGEQSNSSLAFGESALLKVFRRITPGTNPDVEIHEALTRAGNTHIAQLHGYAALTEDGEEVQLAMLQQFLRTASDGWELALASARNLFTDTELTAEEAGGDFASEAHRLGATLAEVHGVLADIFGTGTVTAAETVATMASRLRAASAVVPEIKDGATALAARFAALGDLGDLAVQRIHGDLHLGQTLRTSLGWKLVDFEGEPVKDLAERRLPDSPWRDVAGMIRSFDYAAATVERDLPTGRSAEWTARNTEAFLDGYTEERGTPITAAEHALLEAYLTDKAVYEATYEARNRPSWLPIPLAALARMRTGAA